MVDAKKVDVLLSSEKVQTFFKESGVDLDELRDILVGVEVKDTPSAKWMEEGKEDPFNGRYNCPRSNLPMGNLTDYEFANELFLHGDDQRNMQPAAFFKGLMNGTVVSSIGWLTAAKDRIRWLAYQNYLLEEEVKKLKK